MGLALYITAYGRPAVERTADDSPPLPLAVSARIEQAFSESPAAGLLHLATTELKATLPASLAFARAFGQRYLTQLCHAGETEKGGEPAAVAPPSQEELSAVVLAAPPIKGLEYLDTDGLLRTWKELDEFVRGVARNYSGGVRAYLQEKNPLWRMVGRVTFHLAENKRDEANPFAFVATYVHQVSGRGDAQHLPLARALKEYAGSADRKRLLALLTPIQAAAETLPWVQELVESGGIYQAMAWSPAEAHQLLRDIPALEASGLIVRVPDWWKTDRPPRPQVSVRIGDQGRAILSAEALLDFSVAVTLDGEPLTEAQMRELLATAGGLVKLRGRWVEVDPQKLAAALAHWKEVEREAAAGGISFFDGMRLLAGADAGGNAIENMDAPLAQWSGIEPGQWLADLLAQLRESRSAGAAAPTELQATLRPYQETGVEWLRLLTRLGLGACLADDMGLGKTIQVLAVLLHLRQAAGAAVEPSLLVAPASLLANWRAEIERFAPTLRFVVAHPSEADFDLRDERALTAEFANVDLVMTTYTLLTRNELLQRRHWRLVIVDEAQAIKNTGARQTRAVKQLQAQARIALTGTPVENRLGDLWSLFDFLNPGLLGDAKAFGRVAKRLAEGAEHFAPLRKLVQPYILRRLKTDRRVIADLPEKTEVRAFCGLSREQATLYEHCVRALAEQLRTSTGIERKGAVLACLMQLKQICNHPAQAQGGADYAPRRSAKFERLASICEELAERQEKALIFTQFREITEPLAEHLQGVFGKPGLVLHGGVAVAKRRALVEAFQREDGPPFFVLSLKAGGTGLNLTQASHVLHFDRWWNPAVENQATDRAFRIGQKRAVMVHKFVCRGTVEEKIDALIEAKSGLARDLLDETGEQVLTEMTDAELLTLVALDIHKACEA